MTSRILSVLEVLPWNWLLIWLGPSYSTKLQSNRLSKSSLDVGSSDSAFPVSNVLSTSFLRGLTFDNSIVIVDECQNLSFHELDTIITRIGQDSKIIFCGDFDQTDLVKTNERNGLHDFLRILNEMDEFNCTEFTLGDIVRSGFVRNYLINKIKLGVGMD